MELFRCVFIFLVAFSSAVKVQSRKVSLSYAGPCQFKSDNYLRADCSATKSSLNSSQCEARADGSSKGNAESRFQLLPVEIKETKNKCIQFTHLDTGAKYALKVVNQSRVVFERYQGCSVTTPEEFLFVQELREEGDYRYFRYKPVDNPSMCLGKDINCNSPEKLSLVESGSNAADKVQRRCLFKRHFH